MPKTEWENSEIEQYITKEYCYAFDVKTNCSMFQVVEHIKYTNFVTKTDHISVFVQKLWTAQFKLSR